MNCALGAAEMRPYLEALARDRARLHRRCHPNAGLPNAFGGYDERPETTAQYLREFAESGLAEHRRRLLRDHRRAHPRDRRRGRRARRRASPAAPTTVHHRFSGLEPFSITPETGFVMIGERQNVTGSAKFRRLIESGDYQARRRGRARPGPQRREHARRQHGRRPARRREGHDDVPEPDRHRARDRARPGDGRLARSGTVLEAGLKCVQGKGIVNSISLKEGEEDFLEKARRVKRYGAAVVVMAFDEQGQADTVERKVEICERAYRLLIEQAGFEPEDIIFDPNILAIATGMEEHNGVRARRSSRRRREIKERLPGRRRSPAASRTCRSASAATTPCARRSTRRSSTTRSPPGLDMAIVNAGQLAVYEDIPPDLLEHVEDIIFNRRPDATERHGRRSPRPSRAAATKTRARPHVARGPGRGAALARARARHRRVHRGGHRGGAAAATSGRSR